MQKCVDEELGSKENVLAIYEMRELIGAVDSTSVCNNSWPAPRRRGYNERGCLGQKSL
jgi:hypothetical protein